MLPVIWYTSVKSFRALIPTARAFAYSIPYHISLHSKVAQSFLNGSNRTVQLFLHLIHLPTRMLFLPHHLLHLILHLNQLFRRWDHHYLHRHQSLLQLVQVNHFFHLVQFILRYLHLSLLLCPLSLRRYRFGRLCQTPFFLPFLLRLLQNQQQRLQFLSTHRWSILFLPRILIVICLLYLRIQRLFLRLNLLCLDRITLLFLFHRQKYLPAHLLCP